MRQQLLTKTQELQALSDERSNHSSGSTQELIDLKKRAHLLTEENEVLFQQITTLRQHYDSFNKEQL